MTPAEYQAKWRKENPEEHRKYQADWRARNKDKVKETKNTWRLNNIEVARKSSRDWVEKNRSRSYETTKARKKMLREAALIAYGPRCNACGFDTDIRALDLDHKLNNGAKERRKLHSVYLFVFKNNFPDDYQILCRNCNWIKFMDSKAEVE